MIKDDIKSYDDYRNEKKYTFSLIYAIFSMVVYVCYAIMFIIIGANLAAIIQFFGAFIFMLITGLFKRRILILTRYIGIITSLLLILIMSVFIFGEEFGFYIAIFPIVVVIFLVLDFSMKFERISAYLLSVMGGVIVFLSNKFYFPIEHLDFSQYAMTFTIVNILVSFAAGMMALQYISVEIFSTKDKLYQMATKDSLTGLYNRRTFIQQGTAFFKIAQRGGSPFTLLIFDIDDFKSVNDLYGHIAGDHYLEGISKLCVKTLRDSDFIARYGGEEFAVIIHEATEEQAKIVAEKLRKVIEGFKIIEGAAVINRTISIGVVSYDHKYSNFHQILDKGAKAMYKSKENGKNIITVFNG